jgi:hypothetical protein
MQEKVSGRIVPRPLYSYHLSCKNSIMSDEVKFEEDASSSSTSVLYGRFSASSTPPKMVQWIINLGIAKTPAQANYVLLGVAIVAALLSLYFFFWFGRPTPSGNEGPPGRPANTQGF